MVYDEFDVWAIDPTGEAAPRNLTEGVGRATDTRFRVLDLDDDDPFVPYDEDVYLTALHTATKRAGIHRDRFDRSREPVELLSGDALFGGFGKAADADVVAFTRSTFEDFPNIWVTDADFDDPRQVTDANPQQADYRWGTAELYEWTSADGTPLQGILYKPEGFDPSRQYPMMVYFYERNSDGLHRHVVPAPGSSSINYSFYVSRGYLLFVPDIPCTGSATRARAPWTPWCPACSRSSTRASSTATGSACRATPGAATRSPTWSPAPTSSRRPRPARRSPT